MDLDEKQKIYELAFLVNPSLPEEELLALIEKVRTWLRGDGCEIIKENFPQKRKLGCLVGKFNSAFLASLVLKAPASRLESLRDKMKMADDKVLRHIFVNYTQKELDQMEQSSRTVRIKREVSAPSAQVAPLAQPAPKESPAKKEEMMDKESLEEINKRLEEILGKNI